MAYLADAGIAGENIGVLVNGQGRGLIGTNLQDTAPLGKTCALLVVVLAALGQAVESLGRGLAVRARQRNRTLFEKRQGKRMET